MSRLAAVVLVVVGATACARYGGLAGVAHWQAQHDLACGEDSTDIETLNKNTFRAHGCGKEAIFQCHRWDQNCANLSALAARRARQELACAEAVTVRNLAPLVFQVSACGKQVNYSCEMRDGLAGCVAERE